MISGISTTIAGDVNYNYDVASNGDVVYSAIPSYQIYRYRGGVTTELTNDTTIQNLGPLTDGVNVIYTKNSFVTNTTITTTLYTSSSGELPLASFTPPLPSVIDYRVNNGWAAFTRAGVDGVTQVWLRSSAGDVTQLSFFGSSTSIDALGPNGDASLISRLRRYYCISGTTPVDVGSLLGKSFYQNGQWYTIIGRSLFSITP